MQSRVFDVWVEEHGDTIAVACRGEIDIAASEGFGETLAGLMSRGRSITLDLREVTFIDSSGIRALVIFSRRCREQGVTFRTLPGPHVSRVSRVLGVGIAIGIADGDLEH
ncbi:MAG: STAS domain-containing protein [Actinomycetota bacterium]